MHQHKHRSEINVAGIALKTTFPRLILPALLVTAGALSTPAFAAVAPPSAPNMTDASDSGVSKTDNITSVAQPTFSGTGKPLSVVTLFAGPTQVGFAIAGPSGQWTIAPTSKLSDGNHVMTVRQTFGGVQSASSAPLSIVVDTVAPATPSRADLATESDTGSSDLDNITNTTKPTFQGTSTPGTFISLYNTTISSVNSIGTATVSAQGDWKATVQVPPSSGQSSYFIRASARDAAGNTSGMSPVLAIFVDTDKPASASLPDLLSASDSGASNSDNITNVTTPTFTVKGEPNGKVVLWGIQSSKMLIGTGFANSGGYATIKAINPLNNYYSVFADSYDLAGNKASAASPTLKLNVDTVAPAVPNAPSLDSNSDSGILADKITKVKAPVMGAFNSEANSPIDVAFALGTSTYHAKTKVQSTHLWSVTAPPLPDGTYDVTATATDLAGNTSTSNVYPLTIDTQAPPVPSTPDLSHFTDTGVSDADNITNDDTLEFQGTCQGALNITLYNSGVSIVSGAAGGEGWLVKAKLAKSGPFHISANASDAAGNVSAMSPQLTGLFDTTAPSATLTTPTAPVVKNLNSLAGTAQDPTVNGDSSGLDKVSVGVQGPKGFWSGSAWISDNNELPSTLVSGKWSKSTGLPTVGPNPLTQIQDGDYHILTVTYDKAGNFTQANFDVTVDNTAPTSVQIVTPIPNSLLQTLTDVHGTASDETGISSVKITLQRKRNNVVYYWNGSDFTTTPATIDASSIGFGHQNINWDCNGQLPLATDLDSGLYTISATAYDLTGNFKVSTQSFSLSGSSAAPATHPRGSAGAS